MIEADGDAETLPHAIEALCAGAEGDGLVSIDDAADEAARANTLGRAQGAVAGAAHAGAGQDQRRRGGAGVAHSRLVAGVQALAREFALPIVTFGHAGNGNLHVNILFDPADAKQSQRAHAALARVFALALSLGGTLSGEHGIGMMKREFMPQAIDAPTLSLMRR